MTATLLVGSLSLLVTQLDPPLQRGHKGLANGRAAVVQGGPVDRSVLMAVPVGKQLPLLGGQMVVGREAIAHHESTQRIAQQLDRGGPRSTQTLDEHPHHGGQHDPVPAPPSGEIASIRVAGGGAGFIDVGNRR